MNHQQAEQAADKLNLFPFYRYRVKGLKKAADFEGTYVGLEQNERGYLFLFQTNPNAFVTAYPQQVTRDIKSKSHEYAIVKKLPSTIQWGTFGAFETTTVANIQFTIQPDAAGFHWFGMGMRGPDMKTREKAKQDAEAFLYGFLALGIKTARNQK